MHRRKILFVIGAGASLEVGLPDGDTLKNKIRGLVDIKFDFNSQKSGDYQIMDALRRFVKGAEEKMDVNDYLRAGWKINAALPQALSIDNFIDAHRNDDKIKLCSKLGIAKAILEAERRSTLYVDSSQKNPFNPENISQTWYHKFLQLLTERVPKEEVESVFQNVSVITFNYDRCIEHFLPLALSNYYSIDLAKAYEIVSSLEVLHPYGSIGRLSWQKNTEPLVNYGAEDNSNLLEMSQNILTFTEQIASAESLNKIRTAVASAEMAVFLGFGFHSQNMELLKPEADTTMTQVFATAYGISRADCDVVTRQIKNTFHKDGENCNIHLRSDLKCAGLLSEYWRSLSSSY